MPGLEVIGIVLGGIPFIISAIEHYKDGTHAIRIWRKYKTELASVIRQLRVQQSRLTNVCETLLEGLSLGSKIEAMIKEPFGSLWQDEITKQKLAQRLRRDYEIFEETAMEMSIAIGDIKKRIGLGSDGKQ
ncbi:putative phosphoglycerate mutase pmu1 [Pestalotiopsis sp. IQ-011]